jgi:site-specific DNA-methyltransferase (adenine-specific)/modification methylase
METIRIAYIANMQEYSLFNANSLEKMKSLPDSSIDLILTDPPYNIGEHSTGNMKMPGRKEINNDIAEWDRGDFDPASLKEEFMRILKPKGNIMAFCNYNIIGQYHKTFDPLFDTFTFFIWHKTNPIPKFREAGFLNSCEMVVCMWNKGHTWNFWGQSEMHNFFESPICQGKERLQSPCHPTQKPVKLLSHLLQIASNEGDVILDPFMGVGSTGEAALTNNRKFIGIELDKEYFKASEKRIKGLKTVISDYSLGSFS